ncbi:MAG: hypothetical protein ACUVTL_08140 [Thermoproteota archaeon]
MVAVIGHPSYSSLAIIATWAAIRRNRQMYPAISSEPNVSSMDVFSAQFLP